MDQQSHSYLLNTKIQTVSDSISLEVLVEVEDVPAVLAVGTMLETDAVLGLGELLSVDAVLEVDGVLVVD